MKNIIATLFVLSNFANASFMICENDSFKLDLKSEPTQFVEDDGMQGADFAGELILSDKRTGTSFTYTSVFQTYNEFNDYAAYAMAFSKKLGLYKAVEFEFASEGDTTATVYLNIPSKGFEGYNGFSDYDEKMYKNSQEMACKLTH